MSREQDPERAPLLADANLNNHANSHAQRRTNNVGSDETGPDFQHPIVKARKWQARSPWMIVLLVALQKFMITFSGMMFLLPFYRILEDGICHRHYGDTSPGFLDEKECKVKEVQTQLAYLLGWFGLTGAVIGLIVSLPYGILADRLGRKPTFVFAYASMAFSYSSGFFYLYYFRFWNPYYLLIGAFTQLIGGGLPVAMSVLYALVADVTSEKDRGASFLFLTCATAAGGLIGPPLSGKLMEAFNPWVPVLVVIVITPLVFAVMAFIPETLQRKKPDSSEPKSTIGAMKKHAAQSLKELGRSLNLLKNRNIILIMVTFFIQNPIMTAYSSILVQYISEHFGWTMAQTSYLLSPLGILNLVILAGLPALAEFLMSDRTHRRIRFSPFGKDRFLTELTLVFLIAASIVEGLTKSLAVFIFGLVIGAFGSGATPLGRALLTHYVDSEHTSRLMALISMFETTGAFIGGPILAYWFDVGHQKGERWTGLPFLYISCLCTVALACLMFIREPPRKIQDGSEDELGFAADAGRDSMEPDAPLL